MQDPAVSRPTQYRHSLVMYLNASWGLIYSSLVHAFVRALTKQINYNLPFEETFQTPEQSHLEQQYFTSTKILLLKLVLCQKSNIICLLIPLIVYIAYIFFIRTNVSMQISLTARFFFVLINGIKVTSWYIIFIIKFGSEAKIVLI